MWGVENRDARKTSTSPEVSFPANRGDDLVASPSVPSRGCRGEERRMHERMDATLRRVLQPADTELF